MSKDIPKDIFVSRPQSFPQQGRIAMVTTDGTEDQEFFYPYYRFLEAGYTVDVLTPKGKDFKGKNGAGLEETMKIEMANADEYDLLYIPGGKAPAELKKHKEAIDTARLFAATGNPIAAVCHGPQVLAEAKLIQGRKIAAWPEVEDEIIQAGAEYVNAETVVDGQFITARWPGDLPMHLKKTLEILESGENHRAHRASDMEMATNSHLQ